MTELNCSDWSAFLEGFPDAHLLQIPAWGELKASFGWSVRRLATERAGAQVLFRRLPAGLSIAYIPRGPVGKPDAAFWSALDALCASQRAVLLKIEPDEWRLSADSDGPTPPEGFQESQHGIQPRQTLIIDLKPEEDQILARMKQKTRYNIRLARKKGVVVRPSSDLNLFYQLMQETGTRDQFGVHSLAYYQQAYQNFHPQGACELLVAEFDSEPLAALMVFAHGSRAWYLYGASSDRQRSRMPNYLLQWEAIRWARANGCTEYDLWGVPDEPEEVLERDFSQRHDGLWGVYRFKRGFGGQFRRAAGPWDRVYRKMPYALYRLWTSR